jgi:hypothetical protein
MRFNELRSIAHNLATSLASGCSLLVGKYELNVFGEAAGSPEGFIEVDFLSGSTTGGATSQELGMAIGRFRQVLPELCKKHGLAEAAFRRLRARYPGRIGDFDVTVEDIEGRVVIDTYNANGARPRVLDELGLIRTDRSPS